MINKIDRKDARIQEVVNEVYDLFIDLDADESQLEFPILYTNAREGVAHLEIGDGSTSLLPLFEAIVNTVPSAGGDPQATPRFLVTNLDYDSYVGRLALGRLFDGKVKMNATYGLCREDGSVNRVKFSALYTFSGLGRSAVDEVTAGDICAVAGIDDVHIGDTITAIDSPLPLPRIHVDEPTVSMLFLVNNGPFAGRSGKLVTSRQIRERLEQENLGNVAIDLQLGGLSVLSVDWEVAIGSHEISFDEPLAVPMERLTASGRIGSLQVRGLGRASPRIVQLSQSVGDLAIGLEGRWGGDASISARCYAAECVVRAPDAAILTLSDGEWSDGVAPRPAGEIDEPRLRLDMVETLGRVAIGRGQAIDVGSDDR